ncbi:twin-arginine translocation signal domain-containing protein [Ostreiculturibacter nitratireducens]|uniref:twin-arginine translocation signal domain-containing protein n=1 Tax=Ostreiculturibacter nitratireducens TaxID=3075226 RepID=UPI0031B5BAED
MEDKTEGVRTDRRGFLKFAGVSTIAGGAALATGAVPEAAEAAISQPGESYRETAHVRAYYESARF